MHRFSALGFDVNWRKEEVRDIPPDLVHACKMSGMKFAILKETPKGGRKPEVKKDASKVKGTVQKDVRPVQGGEDNKEGTRWRCGRTERLCPLW